MHVKVFLILIGGLLILYLLYLSWWFLIPVGVGVILWKSGLIQELLDKPKKATEGEEKQGVKTTPEIIRDFEKALKLHGLTENEDFFEIKDKAMQKFIEEIRNIIHKNVDLHKKRDELLILVDKDVDEIESLRNYKRSALDILNKEFSAKLSGRSSKNLISLYQELMAKFRINTDDAKEAIEKLISALIKDGVDNVKSTIKVNIEWLHKSQDEKVIERELEDIKNELEHLKERKF